MKKKIKDLTPEEVHKICCEYNFCGYGGCPLKETIKCRQIIRNSEREVEVNGEEKD